MRFHTYDCRPWLDGMIVRNDCPILEERFTFEQSFILDLTTGNGISEKKISDIRYLSYPDITTLLRSKYQNKFTFAYVYWEKDFFDLVNDDIKCVFDAWI